MQWVLKQVLYRLYVQFSKFFDPCIFIRCEQGARCSVFLDHLVTGKGHLVFTKVKEHAFLSQQSFNLTVPCNGIRFVVLIGINRHDVELFQQRYPDFPGSSFLAKQFAEAGSLITGARVGAGAGCCNGALLYGPSRTSRSPRLSSSRISLRNQKNETFSIFSGISKNTFKYSQNS